MIGIIGARFDEVQGLKDIMKKVKVEEKAGMQFFSGDLCGKDAVVVRCGIGKVNASICAQILVDDFHIDYLINTGVAGSLNNDMDICDIVMKANGECICIKLLAFPKRTQSLRFLDETLYSVTTLHSGGTRFVNRNPHMMMNRVATPNLGFTTSKLRAYSFCLPLELEDESNIRKIMIVDRLPREMTYVKGNAIEYVDLGATLFGFSVHSVKSFLKTIKGEN